MKPERMPEEGRGECRPRGHEKPQGDEGDDRTHLEHGEGVLHERAFSQTDHVDGGEGDDGEYGRELAAGERPPPRPQGGREEDVTGGEEGEEAPEILTEADGDRGDSARHDDEEARPPVEEAPQGAVRLLEEVVHAARAREESAELGVGEGAREREQAPGDPHEQDQTTVRQDGGHVSGSDEDPGADDGTDREQSAVPGAEPPDELHRSGVLGGAHAGSAPPRASPRACDGRSVAWQLSRRDRYEFRLFIDPAESLAAADPRSKPTATPAWHVTGQGDGAATGAKEADGRRRSGDRAHLLAAVVSSAFASFQPVRTVVARQ
jgi:hypothetical protein